VIIVDDNFHFVKSISKENFGVPEQIHGIKVANLCVRLAEFIECEINKEDLYLAALIHDIGLGKIDRDIINKSGELDIDEREMVNTHSAHSAEICEEIGFSEEIINTVLYHHENSDGTGYPEGRNSIEIPLGAKILRICDVFVALTSDRPYRGKFSILEAIEVMDEFNENFDSWLFEEFKKMINKDGFI
jgi:putative nucleotidyltransferase with HDIG domain